MTEKETQQQLPIQAPSGLATSQGQFTALFSLVCVILAFVGINTTPEQITGWLEFAESLAKIVVPVISAAGVLITYTNSRGKIESNTLWANASVSAASVAGIPGIGAILGGKNWKDPQRYIEIARTAGELGVPGVGKVVESISPSKQVEDQFSDEDIKKLKDLLARLGKE